MTMLYRLDADAAAIAEAFGARAGDDPWSGGHVSPGQFAPVVTAGRELVAGPRLGRGQRRITPRMWGVPPPPSATDAARMVASVRNPDSPFWIGNLRNSEFRCLIPATAFMEWSATPGPDGKRRPIWFGASDQPLFAFAGVWKDSEVPGFAILSAPPNALLREQGRHAMPAILPPDREAQSLWLHGDWKRAREVLQPYPSGMMRSVTRD